MYVCRYLCRGTMLDILPYVGAYDKGQQMCADCSLAPPSPASNRQWASVGGAFQTELIHTHPEQVDIFLHTDLLVLHHALLHLLSLILSYQLVTYM